MNEYYFNLPIGDWSGHGRCEYHLVKSNKPVETVREVHFDIPRYTGIDIEKVCAEYMDDTLSPEVEEKLRKLSRSLSRRRIFWRCVLGTQEPQENDDGDAYLDILAEESDGDQIQIDSKFMLRLWIFLLTLTDPSLKLTVIERTSDMLPFYGKDKKDRHIGFVGYGVMEE